MQVLSSCRLECNVCTKIETFDGRVSALRGPSGAGEIRLPVVRHTRPEPEGLSVYKQPYALHAYFLDKTMILRKMVGNFSCFQPNVGAVIHEATTVVIATRHG